MQPIRTRAFRYFAIATLTILTLLATSRLYAGEKTPQTDAERAISALQASMANSDTYSFTAQVEQVLIPRATANNIGQSEERIDSMIIGEIAPDINTIELRFESAGLPNVLMEQEDGKTYVIQEGERTLIDSPLQGTAPGGSFEGYLHAATNITERTDPNYCLLYTSPSPRDLSTSRMPSSA